MKEVWVVMVGSHEYQYILGVYDNHAEAIANGDMIDCVVEGPFPINMVLAPKGKPSKWVKEFPPTSRKTFFVVLRGRDGHVLQAQEDYPYDGDCYGDMVPILSVDREDSVFYAETRGWRLCCYVFADTVEEAIAIVDAKRSEYDEMGRKINGN